MPRLTRVFAALLLAGALAGCTTDSTRPRPTTILTPSSPVQVPPPNFKPAPQNPPRTQFVPVPNPPAPQPQKLTPTPQPQPPPLAQQFKPILPAPTVAPAPGLAGQWISLDAWAQTRGLGRPVRHNSLTNTFQVPTANGLLSLTMGSQSATWNGMKIPLGYAPRLVGRQMFLNPIDVAKTLTPLVTPLSLPPRGARVVVIDPGHGGDNHGAKSVANGKLEKEFALDWARRLKPLLEQRGWKVYLTRTGDTPLSLQERIAVADRFQANLFLSLHFNSGPGNQSGLETYCTTPTGMASSITRDFKDEPDEVLPNNAWDAQNVQYAARLHRSALNVLGAQDRGVRHARFMVVLRGQNRPAVLIEGGYLTHSNEAYLISTPDYRQKLALAVARALE